MTTNTLHPGDILVTTHEHWLIQRITQTRRRTVYTLTSSGDIWTVTEDALPRIERVERGRR